MVEVNVFRQVVSAQRFSFVCSFERVSECVCVSVCISVVSVFARVSVCVYAAESVYLLLGVVPSLSSVSASMARQSRVQFSSLCRLLKNE